MKEPIVFTGMGMVTACGEDLTEIWECLVNKTPVARSWPDLETIGFTMTTACRIDDSTITGTDRGRQMTLRAVSKALQQANLDLTGKRVGIFIGTTLGESLAFENKGEGLEIDAAALKPDFFGNAIREKWAPNAIIRNYGTACAAGNYAIGAAVEALEQGRIDVAIAGGVDPFSKIAMVGFQRSRAMAPDGICRPFDAQRGGMLLGEGAAFFILEKEAEAIARNATPLAIAGHCGLSCDAYHATAPEPGGNGMAESMRIALKKQGLQPGDIGWICAHGSGTVLSDAAEAIAIQQVFGNQSPPVSGFKSLFGHCLGAATAIEAGICILSLQKGTIPPTLNHQNTDTKFPVRVVTETLAKESKWILNGGYAFGGLNSALLIGKWA